MPMDLRVALVLATMGSLVVSDERWVKVMSMKMVDAVEKYAALDLPNLPALASQLGLHALVNSVVKAGLADALSSPGPFTVFGPTDAAFDAIPDWLKKALDKNGTLAELLKYHVLSAKVLSSDIKDEAQVTTLLGKSMRFNIYPNNKVVTVQCSPIDLANVDKMASNGILHEITTVMIPPAGTIVDAVSACPVFKTLVTAVKAADLTGALSGKGPFTLFAPTDKAFAKLPPGTLDNLLKNITALTEILTYHVVNLTYCKAGLVSYTSLQTLNGKDINISAAGDKIKINNAFLLPEGADGSVTNGVVHAIDSVLIPPSVLLYI